MKKIIFGERWLQLNMARQALVGFLPLPWALMGIAFGGTLQKDGRNFRHSSPLRLVMDLPFIFGMTVGAMIHL